MVGERYVAETFYLCVTSLKDDRFDVPHRHPPWPRTSRCRTCRNVGLRGVVGLHPGPGSNLPLRWNCCCCWTTWPWFVSRFQLIPIFFLTERKKLNFELKKNYNKIYSKPLSTAGKLGSGMLCRRYCTVKRERERGGRMEGEELEAVKEMREEKMK